MPQDSDIAPETSAACLGRIVADARRGDFRVWSLIVSIFGDLVLPRRPDIPAAVLHDVLDRLGVDGGAMRTAVSRLAKDGWVTSSRAGRNAIYRLADAAIPEFDVATRTIYAPRRPVPDRPPVLAVWQDRADAPDHPALLPVGRGAWLWTGTGAVPGRGALTAEIAPGDVPEWVRHSVAPDGLADACRALVDSFGPLARAVRDDPLPPRDAAAARALLIQEWRRVALRHPALSDEFLPRDWPEAECRRFVLDLHAQLSEQARPWLDANLPREADTLEALQNVN